MINCVHFPGPPLRFSPGWQNGWAFGPKSLQMVREIQFGCLQDNQHDKIFRNSCQIEGNSEDLCINDRAGMTTKPSFFVLTWQ
jgi:hypothetical protein